ncbi:MAG: BRO-N domain-containing protein, partial [Bacteroidales bacterium]
MKHELFVFDPSGHSVRVEVVGDENWFVAKDVCDALGLQDVSMTVGRLDDDEKLIQGLLVSGQKRQVWMVNESGLYALIFQSRKKEAKAFRKWVTGEVLPSLRRAGAYYAHRTRVVDGKTWMRYDMWLASQDLSVLSSCVGKRKRDNKEGFLRIGNVWYIDDSVLRRYSK